MHRLPLKKTRLTVWLPLLCLFLASTANVSASPRHEIKDPYYGDVLFYFYQQQYFSAITKLMTSRHFERLSHHQDEAELLLGGMYLSYGLHLQAGEIFQRLIDTGAPAAVRDRAWFYLAKIRYQRGYHTEAEEALTRIQAALPGELEEERQLLQAQLLMQRQDYRAAADVLTRMRGESAWAQYGRYNLGVALIKAGDVEAGTALLEKLGVKQVEGEEMLSLKDKANVAIGYAFLRDNAPARAQTYLEKVRLDGLMSNKALLGMGWAHSAQGQHDKSLVPWAELQKRNVIDAAVQESLLAVPYGLGKLGAFTQSLEHYEGAIAVYTQEMARIDDSISAIRSGKMIEGVLQHDTESEMGWFWRMREIPNAPESRYLLHLMAGHDFQEGLKNYRDLRFLLRNLDAWSDSLGVYRDMLATRELAYEKRLPKVLQDERARHIDALPPQRERQAAELARIEQDNDAMALANEKERQLAARLDNMNKNLQRLAGHKDIAALQDKYRLLRGLLFWDVSSEYVPRLWQAKKDLKELDQALAQTQRHRQSLQRAQLDAPKSFANFRARIGELRDRIVRLQTQTRARSAAQEHYLEDLAVAELSLQKERMATYITQARFAVAQMYDEATNAAREAK
ncbi:MAG: hypothetical protein HY081_04935 [Gammaproteobacteria bacterium]|nr:hypothetical protein [Gammaproteobacteria bacterium]